MKKVSDSDVFEAAITVAAAIASDGLQINKSPKEIGKTALEIVLGVLTAMERH